MASGHLKACGPGFAALVACVLVVCSSFAQAALPQHLGAAPFCQQMTLEAEDAACTPAGCLLVGDALVTCGELLLRAERLQLRMDASGQFDGADASGKVLLDDGLRRLQSSHITLGADRVSAQLQGGLLQLRKTPAPAALAQRRCGLPLGPFALTLTGDLTRDAEGNVTASAATLTLCDCGPGKRPSWQLYAPTVRVALAGAQRATVYWPQLRINFLGLALVPITPPLLPISLPLGPRAFGLLVPQVTFLGPPWPTIDVPVFMPITPSWDVTATPGVRMDWRHAPRLGLRLRGAPAEGHSLLAEVHVTADLRHGAATRLQTLTLKGQPGLALDPGFLSLLQQRRGLVWRSRVDVRHRLRLWAPPPLRPKNRAHGALDWHSDAAWVSDDAVLADLGVAASQRVATYLPSRSSLMLRHPSVTWVAGIDAMLRLDTTVLQPDGTRRVHLSNVNGPESNTLHRLPYLQLQLWSRPLRRHLRLQGQLSAVRYGPLGRRDEASAQAAAGRAQSGARAVVGAVWGRTLGPVRARLGVSADGVAFATEGAETLVDGVLLTDGEVMLPLYRAYGRQQHMVSPSLRYRGLSRSHRRGPAFAAAQADALDPYLERAAVQQLLVALKQSLGRGATAAQLTLGLPIDLRVWAWLPPSGRLTLAWRGIMRSETLMSVNVRSGGPWLQHLGQQLQLEIAQFGLRAHYLRAAPGAERFVRTVYELSASPRDLPDVGRAAWAHTLSASGFVALGWGLKVGYGTTLALPKPDAQPSLTTAPGGFFRTYGTAQNLDVSYTSPCSCWGLSATLSAAPQALWRTFRMQVVLTLADTRVGY